jgi:ABC-type enterochelin transport system ATPase subunit
MVNFGKKNVEKKYTQKELVSFGNYLLSKKRLTYFDAKVKKLGQHRQVWDNDISNWRNCKGLKFGKK